MALKDKLLTLLEETGGRTQRNISRIAFKARQVQPDFTPRYLSLLLLGQPARPEDYQALAAAFGVMPADLVDDPVSVGDENRRKVANFLSNRVHRPDLLEPFMSHLNEAVRFREQNLDPDDLYLQFSDFMDLQLGDDDELT